MKTQFSLLFLMILIAPILMSTGGNSTPAWEKENVSFPMMNQEIRNSMQENDRQKEMRKWQTTNMTTETANRNQWEKLKQTTVKIQDRLRIISFAIQSVPTGIAMNREVAKIVKNQNAIIQEISTAPYSIVVIIPAQIQFVDDLQMDIRLIAGIIISYGAINQMEKSERKILLDFALEEIKTLRKNSTYMLVKIRDMKEKIEWKKNLWKYYINRDKTLVKNIMDNIKNF